MSLMSSGSAGVGSGSGKLLQHADEIITAVPVRSRDVDELLQLQADSRLVRLTRHSNGATPSHFNDPFVSQDAKRSQDRVGIDSEFRGEVLRLWNALTRCRLTFGDGSADRSGHLFVQQCGVAPVESSESELGVGGVFWRGLERTNKNNYSSFNADRYRIHHLASNIRE